MNDDKRFINNTGNMDLSDYERFLEVLKNATQYNIDHTGEDNKKAKKIIEYRFDKFIIEVIVDENNNFLGIERIRINKAFYSNKDIKTNDVFNFDKYFEEK